MTLEINDLVYDWNDNHSSQQSPIISVHDESLRDGLQAPYAIKHPSLDEKLHLLRLMDDIGIDTANIGFPASSNIQKNMIEQIAVHKGREDWILNLMAAARSHLSDVQVIVDIVQKTGIEIEAGIFIGSSEMRRFIHQWEMKDMIKKSTEAIKLARKNNIPVMFVTEDTTRAFPNTIATLYQAAIENGANKLCICDTVGFADPQGTENLVSYVKNKIVRDQNVDGNTIQIEWHGHKDRFFDMANSWAAIGAGATRVEGTLLGVGERSGNTPTEALVLNLLLKNFNNFRINLHSRNEVISWGLKIRKLAEAYSKAIGYSIPVNHPLLGEEAFNTASGVHADAILKAIQIEREDLAGLIYCGFNPEIVGTKPQARVGQMSGRSNVILALRGLGISQPDPEIIEKILQYAKSHTNLLTNQELSDLSK